LQFPVLFWFHLVYSIYMYAMFTYLFLFVYMWCLPFYFFLLHFPLRGKEDQLLFLRRVPQCHKDFHGLVETMGSDLVISLALQDWILLFFMTLLNPLLRSHWDYRIFSKMPIQFLWSHWHRGFWSWGLNEIARTDPTVWMRPWDSIK
jgi:hypothetical protein